MSIDQLMGAWTSVKKETIINCFPNCEFKIQVLETFNKSRDFTAEICANLSVDSYLAQDSDKVTSVDFIDKASKTRQNYLINDAILFAANQYQIIEGKVKIFLFILNTSPKDFKYSSCNGYCRLSHCFHRTWLWRRCSRSTVVQKDGRFKACDRRKSNYFCKKVTSTFIISS